MKLDFLFLKRDDLNFIHMTSRTDVANLEILFMQRDRLERTYSPDVLACDFPFSPIREKLEEIEDEIKELMR